MIHRFDANILLQVLVVSSELLAVRVIDAVPYRRSDSRLAHVARACRGKMRDRIGSVKRSDAVRDFWISLAPASAGELLVVQNTHVGVLRASKVFRSRKEFLDRLEATPGAGASVVVFVEIVMCE